MIKKLNSLKIDTRDEGNSVIIKWAIREKEYVRKSIEYNGTDVSFAENLAEYAKNFDPYMFAAYCCYERYEDLDAKLDLKLFIKDAKNIKHFLRSLSRKTKRVATFENDKFRAIEAVN